MNEFLRLYDENNSLRQMIDDLSVLNSDCKKTNDELRNQNKELEKVLNSKRYVAIDFVVDALYKVVKHKSKKQKALVEQQNLPVLRQDVKKDGKIEKINKKAQRKTIKGRVDIININFYDWDGKTVYKGGAERYVYDLACLLKRLGYKPRLLQCSSTPFKKNFQGIEVIGIGKGERYDMRENSRLFNYYCNQAEFIIASPYKLACEIEDVPVIGINHGVDFDPAWNRYYFDYQGRDKEIADSLKRMKKCVCVDTNFINWTRTFDYALAMKEEYIPNYYDENTFGADKIQEWRKDDKIVFVYPRRIYEARGSDITIRAFRRILQRHSNRVIIKFVGQIENEQSEKALMSLMTKYPKNVFREEYKMEDMEKAYNGANVALIPTRYCEGTSLSCIEAMAMGCAVIATNIGGLPNLIIDGFNGKLISPTTDSLTSAIEDVIEHEKKYKKMASNGLEVVRKSFTKNVWEKHWTEVIVSLQK